MPRLTLSRRQALAARARSDAGFSIVLVALMLVFLLAVTAIVVDLSNARQQKREAVAAADAGALAGAQSITSGSPPSGCSAGDPRCVAAYYTLRSANVTSSLPSRSACTLSGETSVVGTEVCDQYSSGGTTVDVKYPYSLDHVSADPNLVHVRVCWSAPTSFGRVIGTNSVNVCGAASARNIPNTTAQIQKTTKDCAGEDNFLDNVDETIGQATNFVIKEGDFPGIGADLDLSKSQTNLTPQPPIKPSDHIIVGAVFHGFDSDVDLSKITFVAPTKTSGPNGTTVTLTNPDKTKGPKDAAVKAVTYSVLSLDATGTKDGKVRAYNPSGVPTHNFVIAYDLPTNSQLKLNDATGAKIIYDTTLKAYDLDQDHAPAEDCGNADFQFTSDGSAPGGTTTCTENSFLANGVFPSNGVATPGTPVGAYYSDESALQNQDKTVNNTIYGVDFEFTDSFGVTHTIKPQGATPVDPWGFYTLTNMTKGQASWATDTYNTQIQWNLPSDPTVLSDGTFTVFLKAYDTDQHSGGTIGHDCGQAVWNFKTTGFTGQGTQGNVRLVE